MLCGEEGAWWMRVECGEVIGEWWNEEGAWWDEEGWLERGERGEWAWWA